MTEKLKKELHCLQLEKKLLSENIESLFTLSENLILRPEENLLFQVRFADLKTDYENFGIVHKEIIKIVVSLGTSVDEEQEQMKHIKDIYYKILVNNLKIQDLTVHDTSNQSTGQNQPQVKLPTIDLPSFDGSLKDWPHFRDLFLSLVHNNDGLSDMEKFHYLVTCLKSEPQTLAKTLPLVSQNYTIVWDLLVERYDNKRLLASHYFNEILNISFLKEESFKSLRHLVDVCTENSQALRKMQFPLDYGDFMLCHIVIQRLDAHTRQLFERKHSNIEFPTFDQLLSFLKNHCKSLEACQPILKLCVQKPNTQTVKLPRIFDKQTSQTFNTKNTFTSNVSSYKCMYCNENHAIYRCQKFNDLTVSQRQEFTKNKQACLNCLSQGHTARFCKSNTSCRKCDKRHHTLLHYSSFSEKSIPQTNQINTESERPHRSEEISSKITHTASQLMVPTHPEESYSTLLGTAVIQVMDFKGEYKTFRALLDPGSQTSFITKDCIQALNLPLREYSATIQGISQTVVQTTKGIVNCCIKPRFKHHPCLRVNAIVLSCITAPLPSTPLPISVREHFKNLNLADPFFDTPSKIDFLLGADLFPDIFYGERKHSKKGFPTAYHTIFGWILLGKTITKSATQISRSHLTISPTPTLESSIKRFWEIEEPPQTFHPSHEEVFCEKHYTEHHSRDSYGRYIVRLPFKDSHPPLGNSADAAKRRFICLEKRFQSDKILKTSYCENINSYIQSGHMEKVYDLNLSSKEHFFLPHHAVVKEESSTTKLRVVFDASAKSSTGVSLNNILHSGPKLQNEITDILLDLRCYQIILSCDIKKMFHQIKVHPDDRNYQLLFWRDEPTHPLNVYRFTSVVFGFSSSPYLAIRTLKQLVKDEGVMYPLAAAAIEKQSYVDDILLGANSIKEAVNLQKETTELLAKGGFELRKWKTNCPELMIELPDDHKEKPLHFQNVENEVFSFLGIKWVSEVDSFMFHINITRKDITKRHILSTVARIFDPCGWLSPITFWTKCLIQLLWSLGLQWDEAVPSYVAEKWQKFILQLPQIEKIYISRCINLNNEKDIQLHGFSDASEAGYSAVVYVRIISFDNKISTHLLIAKSKVAPLKRLSIPRLELCGAHLLAKLLNYCVSLLSKHCQLKSTTAWCDSTVVLSWIHTPPYRLKVFVANRVANIQELVPAHSWLHISTNFNPADCASRGLLPDAIRTHEMWWSGPPWFKSPEDTWPVPRFRQIKEQDLPEVKTDPIQVLANTMKEPDLLSRFSSWTTLLRTVAYILRFKNNLQKQEKEIGSLKTHELKISAITICKIIQQVHFKEEFNLLKCGKCCTSRLISLSPFLDEDDLIRVGGRIKHSHIPYSAKHPIVLPKKSQVTSLIVDFYHLKYLHCGPQFLQATISQTFWILNARSLIRSKVYKCIRCFRCQPKVSTQKMGDLPQNRVTPFKVFNNCGTDFLGPFSVKPNSLRKVVQMKAYICVFICFSVKAVHLEVVTSLTSEAYLAALTRFVSRRGLCNNIYSDCGTNFVGGASEINNIVKKFLNKKETQNAIETFCCENQITFHFLPPAAPHQGGLWERSVRSVKHHLHRVVGNQIMTLEEFITLSTKIEAILNSRPISQLSSDPSEIDYLTPGHFLIGRPLIALPEQDWSNTPINRLSRWQLVQSMSQSFWKRWTKEYLHTLQQRRKWQHSRNNLKIGELVVIHEPNSPPLSWRMGRISGTSPGADGLVRVVQIDTSRGQISRPVTKVSPLPEQ